MNVTHTKTNCLYNQFFFEQLYKYMLDNHIDSALDGSNTVWHLMDVEGILIKEYGYRRTQGGSLM